MAIIGDYIRILLGLYRVWGLGVGSEGMEKKMETITVQGLGFRI